MTHNDEAEAELFDISFLTIKSISGVHKLAVLVTWVTRAFTPAPLWSLWGILTGFTGAVSEPPRGILTEHQNVERKKMITELRR